MFIQNNKKPRLNKSYSPTFGTSDFHGRTSD